MPGTPDQVDIVTIVELAQDLESLAGEAPSGAARLMVGLCGPPGTGKSTTARALRDEIGEDRAVVVQLDGFHLASPVIAGTELATRRGAIDTFDAGGFASLVERLRANDEPVVYAPTFERDLEEPINAAMVVPGDCTIVIVEGNYLLADGPDWERARACLDQVWYLHTDPDLRVTRLVDRHVQSGKEPQHAWDWVERSDEANARLIASTAHRADRVLAVVQAGSTARGTTA